MREDFLVAEHAAVEVVAWALGAKGGGKGNIGDERRKKQRLGTRD
jgi:hypothetical protein